MSFTSDLSIDELLLIEEVGFEPIELCMGSSYFHIGWQRSAWSQNMELGNVSQLMLSARMYAIGRMVQQAEAFGADGIVSMQVDMVRHGHHAEFTAIGTAVRRRDGQGAAWRVGGHPFTCDLSGEDFWGLLRGGFRPVNLAHGVCVYHVAYQGLGAWFKQIGQNVEQQQYTQALYDARELAMERMQGEAARLGAHGVVGVEVREGSHGWESHVVEYVAVGTGVAPIVDPTHEVHQPPKLVMFAQD